jgi:hypothetical protein
MTRSRVSSVKLATEKLLRELPVWVPRPRENLVNFSRKRVVSANEIVSQSLGGNLMYNSHTTKNALGAAWKMPSLDDFATTPMSEKDNLVKMGSLKYAKVHALATNQGFKNSQAWRRNKKKQHNRDKKDQKKKHKSKICFRDLSLKI